MKTVHTVNIIHGDDDRLQDRINERISDMEKNGWTFSTINISIAASADNGFRKEYALTSLTFKKEVDDTPV